MGDVPAGKMGDVSDIPHGTPSGYSWHKCRCDVCVSAKRAKDRDYYQRNADARKARVREYREANSELVSEQQRRYRSENADRIRERKRRYYEEHRDEIIAKVAEWQQQNRDRVRASAARHRDKYRQERRAKALERYYRLMAEDPERLRRQRRAWAKTKRGVLAYRNAQERRRRGVPYTPEALEWIASLVDPICAYCGRLATEIDHIIPISRGGTGDRDNLVPACRRCNARKGSMTMAEFLARKGS